MQKYFLFALFLFCVGIEAKYISKEQIDKNKKTLQVSSCKEKLCVNVTHDFIKEYDYITTFENGYYVTYLVNIDKKDEEYIMSRYKDRFPDMILRKRYIEDKELYALKGLDKDFFENKNYRTKVKTKKVDIYSKPTHKSMIVDTKYFGEDIDIDGCNIYEWCKQKDEKKYLPLYRINPYEKLDESQNKAKKKVINIDPKTFIGKYKLALKYYKEKKYDDAYKILNELFELKPDDLNINFYLGRSAYESKRYDEAVSAYERFLFVEPQNNRVKLEMARAFYMTQTYKEAKKLLLEVKEDSNLPDKTLYVVNYYLRLIDQEISKHFISGVLIGGVSYDSNINSRSKHDTFSNIYISNYDVYIDMTNTTEDDSAFYNQEVGVFNYYYKYDDKIKIKQDFMVYNKDSFASSYNGTDVTLYSYTPAVSIQHDEKLMIDYALYADLMWYGGEKYLKTYALYPKATYVYDKKNIINSYLKYQSKYYQQASYEYKNSYYTELGTSLTHVYDSKWTLSPSVVLKDEEKKTGDTVGIDYSGITLGFSSNYKYKPTLSFAPSFTYSYSKYEGKDSYNQTQQLDKEYKVALSSTYIYSPIWVAQASGNYTYQTSSIQSEEYDKYTFTLNLIRLFQ